MDERLKKFVQLADAGSFVKASRDMHISQPALSVAIAKLERELHTPLLVHGVRPLTLTPAGQLAYTAGKEIMVKTNNLQTQLADLAQRDLAVSIGMIDSVATALLDSSEPIDDLERQASVSLVVDNSRNLLGAVEKGALDLAFVVAQRQYASVIEVTRTVTEPLMAVCHVDQIVEVKKALRTGVLPSFISYDQASTSHGVISRALEQQGLTPEPTFYSTSPEVMLRLVLLQKGVAVLPYLLVRKHVVQGDLVLVGQSAPLLIDRAIVAVKRRDTILPTPLVRTSGQLTNLLGMVRIEAYKAR